MHLEPEVMADYGGVLDRASSDAKMDRYSAGIAALGFGRWLVEDRSGVFLGYCGVAAGRDAHPLGPHFEVGWRFTRKAWGYGYATEAASAALADVFERAGLLVVLAYTAPENHRSQAVMSRLGLVRDEALDFVADYGGGKLLRSVVWVARPQIESASAAATSRI